MTTSSSTSTSSTQRSTVVGVFEDVPAARRAIDSLKESGFRGEDISVLTPDRDEGRAVAEETGSHAAGGAATGALMGGLLGGLGGWLVGIGALAIPGVGPFIAAGAFATALGGAAVGAGVGAIAGALMGMGIPEEHARYYEGEVHRGRTLVTVRAPEHYDTAQRILRQAGAYDVESRGQAGLSQTPATGGTLAGAREPAADQRTLQLREEELHAQARPVQTGTVSVGKEIVEEQRTLDVPVQHEEVVVERQAVERRPADQPIEAGAERTLDIPVREEHVEVRKQPVVYEEVNVGTQQVTGTQQVAGTVRREEARVEQEGAPRLATGTWGDVQSRYRERWQSRAGANAGDWQSVEPGYRYGYELRGRPEYRGQSWSTVEPRFRSEWERAHPETPWERARDAVRESWEESA